MLNVLRTVHPGHAPGASSDRKGAGQGKKQKNPNSGRDMAFVLIEFLRMCVMQEISVSCRGEKKEGGLFCVGGI